MTHAKSTPRRYALTGTLTALFLATSSLYALDARADCLSEIAEIRAKIESGELVAVKLDQSEESKSASAAEAGADTKLSADTAGGSVSTTSTSALTTSSEGSATVPLQPTAGLNTSPPSENRVSGDLIERSGIEAEAGSGGQADTAAAASEPAEEGQEGEVELSVKSETGGTTEVAVPAGDAQPTENWFGRPPSEKTAEEYLEGAEAAARDGDTAACMEQLTDAKATLTAATE